MSTERERKDAMMQLGIQHCMSTTQGRMVLYEILQKSGLHAKIFNTDPLLTAYNSGAREKVGMWLDAELKRVVPGSYSTMQEENSNG